MKSIKLNDILQLDNLKNVKIRFNMPNSTNWNPIVEFKKNNMQSILDGHYSNYQNKSYREGQITIGFVRIKRNENFWLLFHIGEITKDLNILNGVGYEYKTLFDEYEKYFGRLIIKFKNTSQNMIRNADSVMDDCEVVQILPDIFDDIFPGYDKVNMTWEDLSRIIEKNAWQTALQNQKGVYLITDTSNGKRYVGSAYGTHMILGRWKSYVETGHGGNVELIELVNKLGFNYVKENFRYSILEIFKSTTDEEIIIERENWWKEVLLSREFGYNAN